MTQPLFINGRFLTQQITGVQSFARSICAEIATIMPYTLVIPERAELIDSEFNSRILRSGKFNGHLWEQLHLPVFMKKHSGSLLLNLCNTGPAFFKNQVVTIHDLAFLKNPSWFNSGFAQYYNWLIPKLAKNSCAIITVSESIKKELEKTFSLSEGKIYVAGNKISSTLLLAKPVAPVQQGIKPNRFFLLVGSADRRKNFLMAEKVFKEKFPDVLLVTAGGLQNSFRDTGEKVSSSNIIRLGYTDDGTLRWLYENAIGYINPSLYEGFGLTNLEAMAFGCPVICSDLPVFREICGAAAFYFDPLQPDSLIQTILYSTENQQEIANKTFNGKAIFTSFQHKNRSKILLEAFAL